MVAYKRNMFYLLYLWFSMRLFGYECFNLDVGHPIVIENPDLSQKKSLFGYSLVLFSDKPTNETWIKIGAPKASYKNIEDSGIVYHCPYLQPCQIEELEYSTNYIYDRNVKQNLRNSLTGFCMDISYKSGILGISSPTWSHLIENFLVIRGGIIIEQLTNKTREKTSPFKEPISMTKTLIYYGRALAGISLHFPKDSDELLVGVPGVSNYMGTVLRIKNIKNNIKNWQYQIISPNGYYHDYSGYSLTSGHFYKRSELLYAYGSPRGHESKDKREWASFGSVIVFSLSPARIKSPKTEYEHEIIIKKIAYGSQVGEYFGASLAAGDLNGDGLDDIIVGSPFRKNDKDGYNHGSVYIYYGHKNKLKHGPKDKIDGKISGAQFGTSIMYLGDINQDGYGDVAISAPFEDTTGSVYIYFYKSNSLIVSQKISGKDISPSLRGFGISFARPWDIDDNQYNDFAIGAPISGHVVILRSKPVVIVHRRLELPSSVTINQDISFKVCFRYSEYPGSHLSIIRKLTIDRDFGRVVLEVGKELQEKIDIRKNREFCEVVHLKKVSRVINVIDPIEITLSYDMPEDDRPSNKTPVFISNTIPMANDTFCKDCPILVKDRAFKSITKQIQWNHVCETKGIKKKCAAVLEISAKFMDLGNKNNFVLGSNDSIFLKVKVINKGDPAYSAQLEFLMPEGLSLRQSPLNCETIDLGILCDIGKELKHQVSFMFELNMKSVYEDMDQNELNFFLNVSTTTYNIDDRSNMNLTLKLIREANFSITGESNEQSYIYEKGSKTTLKTIFKIDKLGRSPIPYVEVNIDIPYKIKHPKTGIYQEFARFLKQKNTVEDQFINCINLNFSRLTSWKTGRDVTNIVVESQLKYNLSRPDEGRGVKNETFIATLPPNSFYLNCTTESVRCVTLNCEVGPFENVEKHLEFLVKMEVDFDQIEDILMLKDSIILNVDGKVLLRRFNQNTNRLDFTTVSNLIVIDKEYKIAFWIILLSAMVGFILLICIAVGLHRAGFFKREQHYLLRQLKKNEGDLMTEDMLENDDFDDEIMEKMIENENLYNLDDEQEELIIERMVHNESLFNLDGINNSVVEM